MATKVPARSHKGRQWNAKSMIPSRPAGSTVSPTEYVVHVGVVEHPAPPHLMRRVEKNTARARAAAMCGTSATAAQILHPKASHTQPSRLHTGREIQPYSRESSLLHPTAATNLKYGPTTSRTELSTPSQLRRAFVGRSKTPSQLRPREDPLQERTQKAEIQVNETTHPRNHQQPATSNQHTAMNCRNEQFIARARARTCRGWHQSEESRSKAAPC